MWHPEYQFPEYLKIAKNKERCNYFSNGFHLEHALLERSKSRLRSILFRPEQYQIVNLIGPTGVGKTELSKDIVKSVFMGEMDCDNKDGLPAVYIEVPVYGGGSFDWKGLYLRVLDSINSPPENLCRSIKLPIRPQSGRGYSEKHRTEDQIRRALEKRIFELNIKVLIFDEVQHLFKFTAKNTEKSLDILKSIANITKCQIVLIGTYESLRGITWSGQLSRRTENIHFHRSDWSEPDQKSDFIAAYGGLLAHIPFEISSDLISEKAVFKVYQLCCGCIGILKQTIEKALANKADQSCVNLDCLVESSLSTNELIQIAREINEREAFFENDDVSELNALLGIGSVNKKQTNKKKKGALRVGQRKPARDPVGGNA